MMSFCIFSATVLILLSSGESAPLTGSESRIQQVDIETRDPLLGRWTYIAESTNIPGSTQLMNKFVDTIWGNITAANDSDTINVLQVHKMFGSCFSFTAKIRLNNNTLSMERPLPMTEILLKTGCSDCLVLLANYVTGGRTYMSLQLLSRRSVLTAPELEEFKQQVAYLNLPEPVVLDSNKGFCQDTSQTTDLSDIISEDSEDSTLVAIFNKLLKKPGALETLMKALSRYVQRMNGN